MLIQIHGIAQNHITAEELETVVTHSLDMITQQAVAGIVDNVFMEQLTQHVSQPQLQLPLQLPQALPRQ
jgi:hypothetical protein